jgi:hypothetical protein
VTWAIFVLVICFCWQMQGCPAVLEVEIPGYTGDLQRLGVELRKIWNAYLRPAYHRPAGDGAYTILLTALGVRYALGIAILAGLKRLSRISPSPGYPGGGDFFSRVTISDWNNASIQSWLCIAIRWIKFDQLISPRILEIRWEFTLRRWWRPFAANLIGLVGLVLALLCWLPEP